MKKKVLFYIPTLGDGGAERVLVNLVNNMSAEKYEIVVQTLFDFGSNRHQLKEHIIYKTNFKKIFRGNSHLLKLFSPRLLYYILVGQKYDLVISYLEGPTNRIIAGCPYKETKKMCWIHTGFPNRRKYSVGYFNGGMADKGYNKYDRIICVSKSVKDSFLNATKIKNPKIEVLYNTNESNLIREKAKEKIEDITIPTNIISVCTVARLIPIKGIMRLINVHERLLSEGYEHIVIVIGQGECYAELMDRINHLGVSNSFFLIGFRDNPYKYISNTDIYVCSSIREGFSTSVSEALIIGTPVVSTNCSGAHELLGEKNEYGIVTENNENGLYEGIKRMIANAELRNEYKKQALVRGHMFNTEVAVEATERLFDNIINSRE